MNKIIIALLFASAAIISGCGKTETVSEKQPETIQTPAPVNPGEVRSDIKNDAALTTLEIKCSGMTCTSCENTLKSKISKMDGVKEVDADHKKQLVKVSFESNKTNKEQIEKTINAAGYKCEKE